MNNTNFGQDLHSVERSSTSAADYLSILLAILLICAGGYILWFVLQEVYSTYHSVDSSLFVTKAKNYIINQPFIEDSDGKPMVFLEGAARLIAFILFFMFASLGTSVGIRLLTSGTALFPKKAANKSNCSPHPGLSVSTFNSSDSGNKPLTQEEIDRY